MTDHRPATLTRRPAVPLFAPLLFSAAVMFQPPAVGGGFDDPDLQPPLEDPAPPTPGQFEADPFDEPVADPPVGEQDPFGDPPLADPAPPAGDPAEAMDAVEDSVTEIGEDVEAEIDAFTEPPARPVAPLPPMLDGRPDVEPLDVEPLNEAPLSLDPADPNVVEIVEPEATVIVDPEANRLRELIRNPYDIYDLREHAAIPADCLLARQACLPCTQTVTSCAACGGGTFTETIPVRGVNLAAAEEIAQILLSRTPGDARVQYLMFVLRYREGNYGEALSFLEQAVILERADPIRDFGEFMEPIQGRSRVYLERVRSLTGVAG